MIKVMFVCHGNICRSPMAEFVFKALVASENLSDNFLINSSATSTEAIGSDVHGSTRWKLIREGIPFNKRCAIQFKAEDYEKYDYILVMDSMNIRNLKRIIGEDKQNKVFRLLDFSLNEDVADPWYTGDFDKTFDDIAFGCKAFLDYLIKNEIKIREKK